MSGWFEPLAISIVVAAAASYLGYRAWRLFRGRSAGCGNCRSGCGTEPPKQLLSIQAIRKR